MRNIVDAFIRFTCISKLGTFYTLYTRTHVHTRTQVFGVQQYSVYILVCVCVYTKLYTAEALLHTPLEQSERERLLP